MNIPKPKLATKVKVPKEDQNKRAQSKLLTFSFQYWKQAQHFGLKEAECSWFISLLERLQSLSKERVSRFQDDGRFQEIIHYHAIDWDKENIPITREDLTWLPANIRNNDEEYPLYQFSISGANGRVHGFWDETDTFNVVLLDPLHNLQPCNYTEYQIRPTAMAKNEYMVLMDEVDRLRDVECEVDNCKVRQAAQAIGQSQSLSRNIIQAGVQPDVAEQLRKLTNTGSVSISEILSFGISFYEPKTSEGAAAENVKPGSASVPTT